MSTDRGGGSGRLFLALAAVVALAAALPARALPAWVSVGERLEYRVAVWGLQAGQAEFDYDPAGDGAHDYRIVARLWTTPGLLSFLDVRDRVRVSGAHDPASGKLFLSRRFEQRLHEGDFRADKVVTYDRDTDKVSFVNRRAPDSPPQVSRLVAGMRDMFSALYYLRATVGSTPVGASFTVPVHDLTDSYRLRITVVRRETMKTVVGRVPVLYLKPHWTRLGKVPEGKSASEESKLRIWVTDDARRLPVKIRMGLPVGAFTARLTAVRGGGSPSQAPADLPATGPVGHRARAARAPEDG